MFNYFHCLIMLIVTINYLLTYLPSDWHIKFIKNNDRQIHIPSFQGVLSYFRFFVNLNVMEIHFFRIYINIYIYIYIYILYTYCYKFMPTCNHDNIASWLLYFWEDLSTATKDIRWTYVELYLCIYRTGVSDLTIRVYGQELEKYLVIHLLIVKQCRRHLTALEGFG